MGSYLPSEIYDYLDGRFGLTLSIRATLAVQGGRPRLARENLLLNSTVLGSSK